MRAALHSHTLCWFQRRDEEKQAEELHAAGKTYKPLPYIPRTVPGTQPMQRPRAQVVQKLDEFQADNMYHKFEVGRVVTEMVRPDVHGEGWGWQQLRIAGLARAIQTRLYLHHCSLKYCLQSRSSCRFSFPWPRQHQQQYDMNCERVACQRRCEEDDAWLNPHRTLALCLGAHYLPPLSVSVDILNAVTRPPACAS